MNNITYNIVENDSDDNDDNDDNDIWEDISLTDTPNKKAKTNITNITNIEINESNLIEDSEIYAREVDYDLNSDKVYFLTRNIRKNINKMNTYMVHCYNLSRLLNSLYGDILLINLK